MKVTKNLIKAINFKLDERTSNAILLSGEDLYWRDKVITEAVKLIPVAERDFNCHRFSDIKSIEEAEFAFMSTGFFGGANVVIISGYGVKKSGKGETKVSDKEVKQFESILSTMSENTLLIMLDSNVPLSLMRYFMEVDCAKLDAPTVRNYIPSIVAPKKIDGNALYTLVEYCNSDMMRISLEVKKLLAYLGDRNVITLDMVELLVANTIENEIFELSNAIAEKNKLKAITLFERFVARGVGFSVILAMLVNQYRRLLHAALSKKSDKELAKDLNVKSEYAIVKAREMARKYGTATLKKCLDELVDAEYSFKSGVMVEETAVRTVVAKLIAK